MARSLCGNPPACKARIGNDAAFRRNTARAAYPSQKATALDGAGLWVGAVTAGRIAAYLDLLLRRNESVNLVSRKEATFRTLLVRHVVDALHRLG